MRDIAYIVLTFWKQRNESKGMDTKRHFSCMLWYIMVVMMLMLVAEKGLQRVEWLMRIVLLVLEVM